MLTVGRISTLLRPSGRKAIAWGPGKSLGLPTHLAIERSRPHIVHHIKKGSENASAGVKSTSSTFRRGQFPHHIYGILMVCWWYTTGIRDGILIGYLLDMNMTSFKWCCCTLNKSTAGPITPANKNSSPIQLYHHHHHHHHHQEVHHSLGWGTTTKLVYKPPGLFVN